jgi:hypothetical protein
MAGFFKQWMENASEYKRLQQELTEIYARTGVNFMHLHPEITKFLVGMAREVGASAAIDELNEMIEMLAKQFPGATQEQIQQQVVLSCKSVNTLAR